MAATLIALFCGLFVFRSHQAMAKVNKNNLLLQAIGRKYGAAPMVVSNITKTLKQTVMQKTKTQKGRFHFSHGKLHLAYLEPEKSDVIIDGEHIWVVVNAPPEMPEAGLQVSKARLKKDKGTQALLNLLVLARFTEVFTVQSVSTKNDLKTFDLMAKDPAALGIKKAQVTVDSQRMLLTEIVYWDEIENESVYSFTDIQFEKKNDPSLFKFIPPKGAQVTEL